MPHVGAVHGLLLRSAPAKVKGNELAVLPEGTEVKVTDSSNAQWWPVTS